LNDKSEENLLYQEVLYKYQRVRLQVIFYYIIIAES
jgi:hypothetical protein